MRSRLLSDPVPKTAAFLCVLAFGILCFGVRAEASSSRLSTFASLLSDRGLKGEEPDESERLPEDEEGDEDRLTSFSRLAGDTQGGSSAGRLSSFAALAGSLESGARTVTGATTDKRLLGFAQQMTATDAAYEKRYGAAKEDKFVVTNAPAGALELSEGDYSKAKKTASSDQLALPDEELQRIRAQEVMSRIEGMSDREILEQLVTEAVAAEQQKLSTEEQVVYDALYQVYGNDVKQEASWMSSLSRTTKWDEDTWNQFFPYDVPTDGRRMIDIGEYKLTAYCPCEICTGKNDGITKSGTRAKQGRTIAVDPAILTMGSELVIDGHVFTAEDTGSAIRGSHIDIYLDSHEQALAFGTKKAEVYLLWDPKKKSSRN
ncbi:MAG: 3D domain-containing protein [Lachnospiraceae bacterium]|nr:3D domain-containing protein [Lachnospiraceae bacterium]